MQIAQTSSVIELGEISADISTAVVSQLITSKLQAAIAALGEALMRLAAGGSMANPAPEPASRDS